MASKKAFMSGAAFTALLMISSALAFSATRPAGMTPAIQGASMASSPAPEQNVARPGKSDMAGFYITAADRAAMRSAILAQLQAFRRDDAAAAFAHVAPLARKTFVSARQFLTRVQDVYKMAYKSQLQRFDGIDMSGPLPRQRLLMTSPRGEQWLASFSMQRQSGGRWQIMGVTIEMAPGIVI